MKQIQKTIGGILIAGILTTGVGSVAFAADTTSVETNYQQQHKTGRGGDFFSVETLQEKISQLSAEQQTEILALAEQLKAYQPEKPDKQADATDRADSFSQIKEIFTASGITLPDMMEKKERPSDTSERPDRSSDLDGEKSLSHLGSADFNGEKPEKSADGTRENPFITTVNEYLSQLDETDQATVTALLEQMETEQAERMTKRQSDLNEETMETVQALRQKLTQILEDNGITMERPTMPDHSATPVEEL